MRRQTTWCKARRSLRMATAWLRRGQPARNLHRAVRREADIGPVRGTPARETPTTRAREFAAPGGVTWIRWLSGWRRWPIVSSSAAAHRCRRLSQRISPVCAALRSWRGSVPLRRPRGPSRIPVLIAAGITANALGELIWYGYVWAGAEPDVSVADVGYFLAYVGLAAALVLGTRRPHRCPGPGGSGVHHRRAHDHRRERADLLGPLDRRHRRGHHGLRLHPDRVGVLPGSRRDSAGHGRAGVDGQAVAVDHRTRLRRRGCLLAGRGHRVPAHRLRTVSRVPRCRLDARRDPDGHRGLATTRCRRGPRSPTMCGRAVRSGGWPSRPPRS